MAEQVDPNTLSDEALGIPKKHTPSTWAEVNAQKKDADLAAMDAYLSASKMGPTVPEGAVPSSTLSPVALRAQGSNSIPIGGEVGGYQQPPAYAAPGSLPTDVAPKAPEFDLGKTIVKSLESGFSKQAAGIGEAAGLGVKQAAAETGYLSTLAQSQQNMYDQLRTIEENRKEEKTKEESYLKKTADEIANGKIQPNRLWNSLDTAGKIGMGISMVLGGVGSALTKGPNVAMDQFQRMVEADTEAQKAELANKRAGFEARSSVYAKMLDRYGKEDAATAAANMFKIGSLKTKLEMSAAQYKGPLAQANAKLAIGQLEERQAMEYGKLRESLQNSPAMKAQDEILKGIYSLPKETHPDLLKEFNAYKGGTEQVKRVGLIFDKMAKDNTAMKRLGAKAGLDSTIDTQVGQLVPVIKAIMGDEAINKGDVETILQPFRPTVADGDKEIKEKGVELENILKARLVRDAAKLRGFGLLPKDIKTGAPTK